MGIFNKTSAEPETTGTDILRAATRSRRHKGHLGILARDLHIWISDLEAFVDSGNPLPPEKLQLLALEFFNASLDVETDRLRSLKTAEPKPLCAANYPSKFDPKTSPYSPPPLNHDAVLARMPRPVKPEPAKPKATRPGWL